MVFWSCDGEMNEVGKYNIIDCSELLLEDYEDLCETPAPSSSPRVSDLCHLCACAIGNSTFTKSSHFARTRNVAAYILCVLQCCANARVNEERTQALLSASDSAAELL